jgi:hypothetical protein
MKKAFLFVVILLFAVPAFAQNESNLFLVPVSKSELRQDRESVCVLEKCYYITDKVSAERSVLSGEAKAYYPVLQKKIYAAPNDTRLTEQWSLNHTTIGWRNGWERIKDLPSSSSLNEIPIVAVIDTGMVDHEDLPRAYLYEGRLFQADYALNNNGLDDNGHGTHIAGIIGAVTDNNRGVASVSGGMVRVMSIRASTYCLDGTTGCLDTRSILSAIDLILDKKLNSHAPIVAVNMSYGNGSFDAAEYEAIELLRDNGIIAVAAAGNDNLNLDIENEYPAKYDLENIIAVAAVERRLTLDYYSNHGSLVGIAAPGSAILSLAKDTTSYTVYSGTSMAAPFIAGLLGAGVALYNEGGPYIEPITPAQLIDILYSTASAGNFNRQRPIKNNRLVDVNSFFERIAACRDETKITGELCTLAREDYPSEIAASVGSDFGGCSLAPEDKTGLANLIVFMTIPLLTALRRKLNSISKSKML